MPWPWRRKLSVDILPVPHEPSAAERARPERLPDDRNTELIDALLTIRNALTVPVNPGRIS